MLVLQPFLQPELGLMMFKPGKTLLSELARISQGNRLVIAPLPEELATVPSGRLKRSWLSESSPSLVDDERLIRFVLHPDVMRRLGNDFHRWLERIPHCQLADGDYCDKNLTITETEQGAARLCWHHDNQQCDQPDETTRKIARRNVMLWAITRITAMLKLPESHRLTLPELCWWSVIHQVYELLPAEILDEVLGSKPTSRNVKTGMKDTNARYSPGNRELIREYVKPVTMLKVDPEPPALFMARPKPIHWESENYLKFVRSQPCVITGRTENIVAHHLIGYGEGKMGGKTHDLFTFPLEVSEHRKFHDDPKAWEARHGSQLFYVKQVIRRALEVGVVG